MFYHWKKLFYSLHNQIQQPDQTIDLILSPTQV